MKKMISMMLLAVLMCFGLTACGSNGTENREQQENSSVNDETKENELETVTKTESIEILSEETDENEQTADEAPSNQSGTLVVYFSCTGTTKGLAEAVAEERKDAVADEYVVCGNGEQRRFDVFDLG